MCCNTEQVPNHCALTLKKLHNTVLQRITYHCAVTNEIHIEHPQHKVL